VSRVSVIGAAKGADFAVIFAALGDETLFLIQILTSPCPRRGRRDNVAPGEVQRSQVQLA
jgi:hypothetical protein